MEVGRILHLRKKERGSGRFEAVNKELTKSQEDLLNMMHAFKSGQATLSEVETQFQQWQEKHNPQEGQPLDIEKDDLLQCPVLFSGVSKRPNRKVSDASGNTKRFSGSSSQSRLSSSDTWRKFSSTSISSSSNSSKNNDGNSVLTVQAQQCKMSKNLPHQLSTGWIPSYSTTRITTLDAKKDPPPVPNSQRPFSKNTMNGITRSRDSTRRKAGTYIPPSLVDLNVVTNQEYKNNDHLDRSLEPLFQICEKYGLGNLSDYFFNELNQDKDVSTKIENENDGSQQKKETNQLLNQSCLQLPLSEWDPENTSSLQRSLSLPSTLFPTDVNKAVQDNTGKSPKDMDISKVDLQESAISKCEEYVNSIQSHAYASIQAYISMQTQNKNDSLQANILSASQQELLQIMNAFKRGEKTISQVERQFEDWHTRHMEATSRRDQQLKQLKNQYEKAQKSSTFGIKNFILGKPKNKTSKTSVTTSKTGKRSVAKGDRDSRRLSKVSYTSTSSGMSDNSDVFKNNCYFNPAYEETAQEVCRRNLNTSKVSSSSTEALAPPPPPLPPRPTLTPVFIMKKFTGWMEVSKEEVSDISEPEKSPAKSGSSSPINIIKKKPSPPPKPVNLFKKVSNTSPMESENKQDEKQAEDTRPESPTYIVPNKVIPSSKKKLQSTKSKQGNVTFVEQCPVRYNQLSDKKSVKLAPAAGSSANTNIQDTKIKKKISLKPKQSEDSSSKRQIIPSPWSKLKRPEESKFYVKRRCSSVPDLPSLDLHTEPIYLDLLDLWENRNRSISESNSPAE